MDLLVWGESLLKHRTVLAVSLIRQIIDVAGREIPVNVELVLLGEEVNIPWDVRLFPLVVILTAKGLTGVILALFSGVLILYLNNAFGAHPAMLLTLMVVSSIFAAAVGIIMGVLVNDINTLFTIMKSLGIFLYAPAFIFICPEIPQWIAKIFPTYYTLNPIIELTLNNASWADIATDVYILIGLTSALIGVAGFLARRAMDTDA